MVLEIDFDNMDKYKCCYIQENVDIEKYEPIELFFNKSMIRTASGYIDTSLNLKNYETIFLRIMIYALIDYYDITNKTDINYKQFMLWVSRIDIYSRYFPLVYIYWKLTMNESKKYNSLDIDAETREGLMKSNLSQFSQGYMFDINDYKKSKINPKYFKYIIKVHNRVIVLLNGFILSTYDVYDKNNIKIENVKSMNNSKSIRHLKLNRNFFRIRENIVNHNWLL
jgi:hypothetical protein